MSNTSHLKLMESSLLLVPFLKLLSQVNSSYLSFSPSSTSVTDVFLFFICVCFNFTHAAKIQTPGLKLILHEACTLPAELFISLIKYQVLVIQPWNISGLDEAWMIALGYVMK